MNTLSPLRQVALGVALCVVGFGGLAQFASCTSTGQLTPVLVCKLDALKVLPDDPMQATVYDAVDVINRVRACHVRPDHDAGAP